MQTGPLLQPRLSEEVLANSPSGMLLLQEGPPVSSPTRQTFTELPSSKGKPKVKTIRTKFVNFQQKSA